MEKRTVGRFSHDAGTVRGPADYMRERGNAKLAEIEAGRCVVVSYGVANGHDPVTTILVALQTDYAAWRGMQQLLGASRPRCEECGRALTGRDSSEYQREGGSGAPRVCEECAEAPK